MSILGDAFGRWYKAWSAPGSNVTVLLVRGWGDQGTATTFAGFARDATAWLDVVLNQDWGADLTVRLAFQQMFRVAPGGDSEQTVRGNLVRTRQRLAQAHNVKVHNMRGGVLGYVLPPSRSCCGRGAERQHDIHLHRGLENAPTAVARARATQVYLHEATHRFANTEDVGPRRGPRADDCYVNQATGTYNNNGEADHPVTAATATRNADSHAYFVRAAMVRYTALGAF